MLARWTKYIGKLFHDERGDKPVIQKNMDGPKILTSEVRTDVSKTKRNKAAGPGEIVVKIITAMDDFGLEKLTACINETYDTGKIPEDLSKSIFIALPKKPEGAIERALHRTISLVSHIKIISRTIMLRAIGRLMLKNGIE